MSAPRKVRTLARSSSGFYRWQVEIAIDPTWVADGFELTPDRLQSILEHALPYARSYEIATKVLGAPDRAEIRDEQGYPRAKVGT